MHSFFFDLTSITHLSLDGEVIFEAVEFDDVWSHHWQELDAIYAAAADTKKRPAPPRDTNASDKENHSSRSRSPILGFQQSDVGASQTLPSVFRTKSHLSGTSGFSNNTSITGSGSIGPGTSREAHWRKKLPYGVKHWLGDKRYEDHLDRVEGKHGRQPMAISDESVRGTFKRKDSAPYLFMYEKGPKEEDYATLSPQPTLERKPVKAESSTGGEKRRKSKGLASIFPFFRGDKKKKRRKEQEAEEAAIKAQVSSMHPVVKQGGADRSHLHRKKYQTVT